MQHNNNNPARNTANGRGLSSAQRREVLKLISKDVEKKYYQSSFTPNAISNSGTITNLSALSQGVTHSGRVGDVVSLKELQFNFDCIASQATLGTWLAGDAYNNIRLILFRWFEDSATAAPTVSSVLNTGLTVYTYLSPYNEDSLESGSLRILFDRTYILENTPYWNGTTTLFASGQSSIHNTMNAVIPKSLLGDRDLVFNDILTTGVGHVYALMISDSASTPHPYAQAAFTLKYTDS